MPAVLKQFLVYIVAAAVALMAVAFHFGVVRGISAQYESKLKNLQTTRDKLKAYADRPKNIRNDASIEAARKRAELMTEQINESERYLARQPRRAQTRRFFENEKLGTGKEIKENVIWRRVYEEQVTQLQNQLLEAGITAFSVQPSAAWGSGVPDDEQVTAAMELFWRQKDMADFLTEQVEKDLTEYMTATSEAGAFPAKPSDLVISRNYARLDELLRDEKPEVLIKTFQAIIFNAKDQDLAIIFDENLPTFPWSQVLTITLDETQRRYLDNLVPADKEDLADRQRFKDFVMEMRLVRYRSDVIGLLDSRPGFDDVASMLRKGTEEERARLVEDMGHWNTTKLAQAIAGIVCLRNEKDYQLVRNNHSPQIAELASLQMDTSGVTTGSMVSREGGPGAGMPMPASAMPSRPPMGGGPGGRSGAGEPGMAVTQGNELYKTFSLSMHVKVEFEHIPVFIRRLLGNSWRYRIKILSITPTTASSRPGEAMEGRTPGGMMPGGMMPGGMTPRAAGLQRPGPGVGPGVAPGRTTPTALPLRPPTGEAEAGTVEPVEVKNYVWLDVSGEAYQFSPVRGKLEGEAAKAASATKAAGAGGTAP